MTDYKKSEENFKKKYGYLISNHPIEYALIYFLVFFGALSLAQDVLLKLGFKIFTYDWYKYIFDNDNKPAFVLLEKDREAG
jgi:hypothetical protein